MGGNPGRLGATKGFPQCRSRAVVRDWCWFPERSATDDVTSHFTPSDSRVPQRPMTRSTNGAVLGGVCAGLACALGARAIGTNHLQSVGLFFGAGFLVYMAAWLFVPRWGEDRGVARRLVGARRESHIILLTFLLALFALLALGASRATVPGGRLAITAGRCRSGRHLVRVLARREESSRGHRERHADIGSSSARGWRALAWRLIPGIILLVVGLKRFAGSVRLGWRGPRHPRSRRPPLGAAILLAPWWLDNVRDLSRERRERVRIEERAKLVAHVHDSVLQTLTLIEKAANSPTDVVRLARPRSASCVNGSSRPNT